MSLTALGRLVMEFEQGRRSAGNLAAALEAYQGWLGGQAQRLADLPSVPAHGAGIQEFISVLETFHASSEMLLEYARSGDPGARAQAMQLAVRADGDLGDLLWHHYEAATRSFAGG